MIAPWRFESIPESTPRVGPSFSRCGHPRGGQRDAGKREKKTAQAGTIIHAFRLDTVKRLFCCEVR